MIRWLALLLLLGDTGWLVGFIQWYSRHTGQYSTIGRIWIVIGLFASFLTVGCLTWRLSSKRIRFALKNAWLVSIVLSVAWILFFKFLGPEFPPLTYAYWLIAALAISCVGLILETHAYRRATRGNYREWK